MRSRRTAFWSLIILFIGMVLVAGNGCNQSSTAPAKEVVIAVSHQPCVHALPTYMAMTKGWDKADGFKIDYQFYASGPPQNEALASNKWEVGAEGAVPGMLAAIRYGAYIIAISNDESETNDLWVRPNSPILKAKGVNPKYPDMYGSAECMVRRLSARGDCWERSYSLRKCIRPLGGDYLRATMMIRACRS